MASYRQVGGRLGAYIRANNPSTQQIQALLADLLAGDQLLMVMSDLVSRPNFKRIAQLAGSGNGDIEIKELRSEISVIYTTYAIDSAVEILNGMLDRRERPTSTSEGSRENSEETPQQEAEGEAKTRNTIDHRSRGNDFFRDQKYLFAAYEFELEAKTNYCADVLLSLGRSYYYAEDYPKARLQLENGIKQRLLEEGHAHNIDHFYLGKACAMLAEPEKAIEHLSKAIELTGARQPRWVDLGEAYLTRAYSESLKNDPNWRAVYSDISLSKHHGISEVEFGGEKLCIEEWLEKHKSLGEEASSPQGASNSDASDAPYKDTAQDFVLGVAGTFIGYIWIGNMLRQFSLPAFEFWPIVQFLLGLGFLCVCLLFGACAPFGGMKKSYRFYYFLVSIGIAISFFSGFVLTAKNFWLGALGFLLWVAPTPLWLSSLFYEPEQ